MSVFKNNHYAKTLHLENKWKLVSGISIPRRFLENNLVQDVAGASEDILSLLAMLAVINPGTAIKQRALYTTPTANSRNNKLLQMRKHSLGSTSSSHTAYR